QNSKIKTTTENAKIEITDNQNDPIVQFNTNEKETSIFGSFNIQSNQQKGKLAEIILKNLEGKNAVIIDASGNASFSGKIIADSLEIEKDATIAGDLNANKASFSGKLTAKEIESENLNNMILQIENSQRDINEIQRLLSDIRNQSFPNPQNQTDLSQTINFENINTENLNSKFIISENMTIINQANLNNLSVSGSILVNQLFIENNSIVSLGNELKLSSLSTINFFEDKVIISKNGTITTQGQIIAYQGIKTNKIETISSDNDLLVQLNKISNNKLKITNNTDEVASINASGEAFFKSLALEKFTPATPSSSIIASSENFNKNGIFAPAIETSNTSAGIGIIPSNSNEIIIYNNNVRENSLIYITPTTNTNKTFSVIEKKSCKNNQTNQTCKPYFKVIISSIENKPIEFNWLIVN
ncbi:MAG: hypothetical protein N2593_02870, partial [Patescibacteria group bacterium]|nr:hypothetical protein [Patescibacteria group bacterium]